MGARTLIDLDPASPGLDHHRAGGHPLFGTSLGTTALTRAARERWPGVDRAEQIGVHEPYILHEPGPHRIAIEFDAEASDALGWFVDGRVIRAHPAQPEMLLFDARFRRTGLEAHAVRCPAPAGQEAGGIAGADVYRVFFPGPAFQVIDAARLHGATLVSRLSAGPVLIPSQARLTEFAMQSAGLLELATSSRRMIPHRIGSISPLPGDAAPPAGPLFAIARAAHEPGAIDIDVIDAAGAPVLTLARYETVELPFPAEPAPAATLSERLRTTAAPAIG